jgi:hypothetical protein
MYLKLDSEAPLPSNSRNEIQALPHVALHHATNTTNVLSHCLQMFQMEKHTRTMFKIERIDTVHSRQGHQFSHSSIQLHSLVHGFLSSFYGPYLQVKMCRRMNEEFERAFIEIIPMDLNFPSSLNKNPLVQRDT